MAPKAKHPSLLLLHCLGVQVASPTGPIRLTSPQNLQFLVGRGDRILAESGNSSAANSLLTEYGQEQLSSAGRLEHKSKRTAFTDHAYRALEWRAPEILRELLQNMMDAVRDLATGILSELHDDPDLKPIIYAETVTLNGAPGSQQQQHGTQGARPPTRSSTREQSNSRTVGSGSRAAAPQPSSGSDSDSSSSETSEDLDGSDSEDDSDRDSEPCSEEEAEDEELLLLQQQGQHTVTYIRARRSAAEDDGEVLTCAAIECIGTRLLLLHQASTVLDPCALEIFSEKAEEDVGGHGEGLKVAALEALRQGYEVMILQNQQSWSFKFVKTRVSARMRDSKTLAVKRTDLAAAGVPNDDSTCLTTVFLAANMPRPGKQAERTCPANGVQAAWRPDRFLQLSLPPSLGWRQGDPLVLLPEASGYHQAEGTSRGSLSCRIEFLLPLTSALRTPASKWCATATT